jgi:hypothetical protein
VNSARLKVSIAVAIVCVVAGCAQDIIPESALPKPGPVGWAPSVTSEPSPPPDGKAQNVIPEPTPKPDDKPGITLDCSGLLHGWNNCLLTASSACGSRGYTILDRSDQYPPRPEDSAFTRSMHIRCNS